MSDQQLVFVLKVLVGLYALWPLWITALEKLINRRLSYKGIFLHIVCGYALMVIFIIIAQLSEHYLEVAALNCVRVERNGGEVCASHFLNTLIWANQYGFLVYLMLAPIFHLLIFKPWKLRSTDKHLENS